MADFKCPKCSSEDLEMAWCDILGESRETRECLQCGAWGNLELFETTPAGAPAVGGTKFQALLDTMLALPDAELRELARQAGFDVPAPAADSDEPDVTAAMAPLMAEMLADEPAPAAGAATPTPGPKILGTVTVPVRSITLKDRPSHVPDDQPADTPGDVTTATEAVMRVLQARAEAARQASALGRSGVWMFIDAMGLRESIAAAIGGGKAGD